MDTTAISEQRTEARFFAKQERIIRDMGDGDTEGAMGITREAIGPLTEFIKVRFENFSKLDERDPERQLF
jgi:hypothetical protein